MYERRRRAVGQLPGGIDWPEALMLQQLGIYTPWAEQRSDTDFVETTAPKLNLALFQITDLLLRHASAIHGGELVEQIGFLTPRPQKLGIAEAAFMDSPYKFFKGGALYRQDDQAPVPKIHFLYLGQLRDPTDPLRGRKNLDTTAQSLAGMLVYPEPLDMPSTTLRGRPVVSFDEALATQLGMPSPIPGDFEQCPPGQIFDRDRGGCVPYTGGDGQPGTPPPTTMPPPVGPDTEEGGGGATTTTTQAGMSTGAKVALGSGVALVTGLVVYKLAKPRRRARRS